MRVLHVAAGNLYGGVERILVEIARARAVRAMSSRCRSRAACRASSTPPARGGTRSAKRDSAGRSRRGARVDG